MVRTRLFFLVLAGLVLCGGANASQDAVPQRRVADVSWPTASFGEVPPRVSPRIAHIIAGVKLPVLIPASFARYRSFDVVSAGPYDYTASIRTRGAKLWINGTRQEVVPPAGALAAQEFEPQPGAFIEPDPPEPKLVNRRFSRYGAGYVISAECLRPDDKHCDDETLEALERAALVFGGSH